MKKIENKNRITFRVKSLFHENIMIDSIKVILQIKNEYEVI